MQIIKKLFCSHFSVNKGLIQHVVQSCYNYNITFRKLEIHTVKMRPISACYTSGRGARHFLGIGRCTITLIYLSLVFCTSTICVSPSPRSMSACHPRFHKCLANFLLGYISLYAFLYHTLSFPMTPLNSYYIRTSQFILQVIDTINCF